MVKRTIFDIKGALYVWMHVTPLQVFAIFNFMYTLHYLLGSFACFMLVESPSGSGFQIDGLPCIDRYIDQHQHQRILKHLLQSDVQLI